MADNYFWTLYFLSILTHNPYTYTIRTYPFILLHNSIYINYDHFFNKTHFYSIKIKISNIRIYIYIFIATKVLIAKFRFCYFYK